MNKTFQLRNLLTFILLIGSINDVTAQSELYPFATEIIKFDIVTKRADKAIPFDKPFTLVIENISTESIIRVLIYRVKVTAGTRALYPDAKNNSFADYVFSKSEVTREKTKITLNVPPLRPSMDFDILIERKLSGRNLERAQALDKIIVDQNLDPNIAGFSWPKDAAQVFTELLDSTNNNNFIPQRTVFGPSDEDEYYQEIFLKYKNNYGLLISDVNYKTQQAGTVNFLGAAEKQAIAVLGPANAKSFNDAFFLERMSNEQTVDEILLGLVPAGYVMGAKRVRRDEFDKRASNISTSIHFFDTLYNTVSEMAVKNPAYKSARDSTRTFLNALLDNRKLLMDNIKVITGVRTGFKEAVWLIGTTGSKDLTTKSSSIFTLDAGFTNLWARDLNNKIAYIPKLYWGVNIYFRGTDKNIRSRYMPSKKSPANVSSEGELKYCDYDILTRKSIWTNLCLTAGFTFGSLDKQNFDNFFAGSSMLIGPSLRLTRSFRLSTGAAFLKRLNQNPALSDKRITVGSYLSASLDFDILSAIKNATNLFFK